jgi:replicative DNA helicase
MTGLDTIDNSLGGLFPGELTVVAARTSNGKTALALQIAEHNAERNRPVLFFSLEMTATELGQRLLCGRTQVDNRDVRKGTVGADDVARLIGETKILATLPLWVWARYGTTLAMIRGLSQIHHSRHGIRMIVVDYIARVKRTDFRMERREFIGEITNGLKDLAKELNVPVLALSQLNREAEGETPSLAMLSESSSVENDADAVLFLHRDREHPETKLIIAKQRHGVTGTFSLYFDGPRTRFLDERPAETCSNYTSSFRDFNEPKNASASF